MKPFLLSAIITLAPSIGMAETQRNSISIDRKTVSYELSLEKTSFMTNDITKQIRERVQAATTPTVQSEKWWRQRHADKIKNVSGQDIEILMIGDSITHDWEGKGKRVWNDYYSHRKAGNIGFSGDRTENVIWRLQNGEIEKISPRLCVLLIGTNNTGHRMDPVLASTAGIAAIISELRLRLPESKILLLGIFPRSASPDAEDRQRNDRINDIIKDFADSESVHFLDIGKRFLHDDGRLNLSLMPDELHPNEAGYKAWAQAMEPTLNELLNEN